MNPIAETTLQLQRNNWTGTRGNYSLYAYYTGVEAGNPSGNTQNLKSIAYYNGNNVLVFTVVYAYDATDRVISETSI